MGEHTGSALHYGHVGRAVYLPEEEAWTFTRSFDRPPSIQYTGMTKTRIPSPFPPAKVQPIPRAPPKNSRKLITNAHPDLAASWSSIREEPLSRAVIRTVEYYDPEISALFDIGYAVDQRRHDKRLRSVPIAVAVTGEGRNIISFRTLEEEILELTSPRKLAFRAPSINDTEMSEWSKDGAPIRQVHFARPLDEKPMFMAARLATGTTIFRPLYHWDPVPRRIPEGAVPGYSTPLQNSRLDANPIVEISVSRTGGVSHADVTFNPWYQRQFAIVDTRGKWKVWEITGRQRLHRATWSATLVKSGSLPLRDYKRRHSCPRLDGWASIEWVHNVGSVVVANRHSVIIYAITDDQIQPRTVELGMAKKSEWVLGVQRNTRKPSQFFVLTTTRILWFDLGALPGEDDTSLSLYPQVSWRHFRDPEDTTLQLSDIVVYKDLYLVLYSQITRMVQVFPCPFISDDRTESISVPDPLVLDTPLLADIPPSKRDSVLRFSRFVFKEIAHSVTPRGRNFYDAHLPLFKLFWMDSDLAVHESTFTGPRGDLDEPDSFRETSILRLRRRYAPTSYIRPTDDFIVDDWDESATQKTIVRRCKPRMGRGIGSDLQWTLDFSGVYKVATGKTKLSRKHQNNRQKPKPRTLAGWMAILQSEMKNGSKRPPGKTMVELTGRKILADGLEESADDMKRLISALVPEHPDPNAHCRYMLLSVPFSNKSYIPAKLSGEVSRDLLSAYDRMVDDWMSTLPRIIPVHIRLMKERIIRGVATDLILSRLVKMSTSLDTVMLSKPADPREEKAIEKANEKAAAHNKYLQSTYFALLSSQMSKSQSSRGKNRGPGSKRDKMPVPQSKYSAVPVLGGLSAFVKFKTPRPTPRNVANLLSHWPVGTSPRHYEWDRIEDEETRSSKASKNKRKKRSQTRDQSLPPTPAVPMVRTWGSQPLAPPRINSSQLDISMTQMERGAFGARAHKKPKKKKRQAGF